MIENFEADIVIKDGSLVHVRSLYNEDEGLLLKFVEGLSEEAIYFRFFGSGISKESAVHALMNKGQKGFGIVALRDQRIVAHAGYYISSPSTAETGVIVAEEYRQKGLASLLLGELGEIASRNGVLTFEAIVVPENYHMLDVLRNLGFPIVQKIEPGAIRITYPTSLIPGALESFDRRETIATCAAVDHILRPKSVAVIGDSFAPDSMEGDLLRNLKESDFNGTVYPVNAGSIPDNVELAFVTVAAERVIAVAKECAWKGVSSLVVLSSGFAEAESHGAELQNQLVQVCRESGMRLVGPSSIGIVNTDPTIRLNGQLSSIKPFRGRMGFLSQSGSLGIAAIDTANKLGLGLSSFVSVGNKADISGNDLLQYWETDNNTDLILLYLESFGNPRKFGTITRRLTKKKPIFVVKSGRSPAGFRATQSHTGTLLASSDVTVEALFKQAGVIRAETLEEMFDAATLLSTQPIPRGNRVGIITNTGGAGILATDACESQGLEVPELREDTQEVLQSSVPRAASVKNPVDLGRHAQALDYGNAIKSLAKDPNVDALILIFIPSLGANSQEIANEVLKAEKQLGRNLPIAATFMASRGITNILSDGEKHVPSYPFPESAARALSHVVRYGNWVRKPVGGVPQFEDSRKSEAAAIVARAMKDKARWLSPEEIALLLDCYHIPTIKKEEVQNDSIEMFIGVTHDSIFGPIVACSVGGPYIELIKDLSIRLAPLTEDSVDEMLASLKTYPILTGYRGAPPADIRALREIILRVGKLADEIQEITEMDLSPIIVRRNEAGAYVAGAKIRIGVPAHQTPIGAKR